MEDTDYLIGLQVETGTTCNSACKFCPYTSTARTRSGKQISEELFKKITDEIKTIPRIHAVLLQGLNEPLLDKRLERLVGYVRDAGKRCGIYTNGFALTKERIDSLTDAGLTTLVISLNAVTQEQHEAVMGVKDKFDYVCAMADYAILQNRLVVNIHAVFDGSQFTREDIERFTGRWGDTAYGGNGQVVCKGNWNGDVPVAWEHRRVQYANRCCQRATHFIYVMYDGRVSACCFDPFGKLVFGDLNTQTLREIYSSPAYVQFREDHSEDRADLYDICKGCTRI